MYACICRGVTESEVRRVGRMGVVDPDELIAVLGLDDPSSCGCCLDRIEDFVALAMDGASAPEAGAVDTRSAAAGCVTGTPTRATMTCSGDAGYHEASAAALGRGSV